MSINNNHTRIILLLATVTAVLSCFGQRAQVYGTQTFSQMKTIIVKAGDEEKPENGTGTAYTSESANYLWPVENADSLDIRRARVGLPSIGTYMEIFGEMGMTLLWDKEMTVDEASRIKTGNNPE